MELIYVDIKSFDVNIDLVHVSTNTCTHPAIITFTNWGRHFLTKVTYNCNFKWRTIGVKCLAQGHQSCGKIYACDF